MSKKRTDWFWLAWLGAFLLVEIPSALLRNGCTFSRFIWRIFRGSKVKEILVFGFCFVLAFHLSWEFSVVPTILTGGGLAYVIVRWFVKER